MKIYVVHAVFVCDGFGYQSQLMFEDQAEANSVFTRLDHAMRMGDSGVGTFEHADGMKESIALGHLCKVSLIVGQKPPQNIMTPNGIRGSFS